LNSIPFDIDIVDVFRRPEDIPSIMANVLEKIQKYYGFSRELEMMKPSFRQKKKVSKLFRINASQYTIVFVILLTIIYCE